MQKDLEILGVCGPITHQVLKDAYFKRCKELRGAPSAKLEELEEAFRRCYTRHVAGERAPHGTPFEVYSSTTPPETRKRRPWGISSALDGVFLKLFVSCLSFFLVFSMGTPEIRIGEPRENVIAVFRSAAANKLGLGPNKHAPGGGSQELLPPEAISPEEAAESSPNIDDNDAANRPREDLLETDLSVKTSLLHAGNLLRSAIECDLQGAAKAVQAGAPIDETDDLGNTAFSWSLRRGCLPVAKFLASRGADTSRKSSNGFSPWDWGRRTNNPKVIKFLYDLSAPGAG